MMVSSPSVSAPFQHALEHLETVLRGLRTGRASTGLIEHLEVEAYGSPLRLKEIATMTIPDARTLQIEPWDTSLVTAIEKALTSASLGATPSVAGTVLRVSIPHLTEERRKELTKLVRQHVEECRVSIRAVREKLLKEVKANQTSGKLSEDAAEREQKGIQQEVDAAVAAAEAAGNGKEQELLRF